MLSEGLGSVRVPQLHATRLRGLQCGFGSLRDQLPLMFRYGSQEVDRKTVGVGIVDRDEVDPLLHEA